MSGVALATGPADEPDLLSLIADGWTPLAKPAADRFRAACRSVARDHSGDVNPSLVRALLLDANGELDIPPRQFSALWATACARGGYLEKTDVMVPITGAGSRHNGNKSVRMRRWIGDPWTDDQRGAA